jgi:hypothetical protein
MSTETYPWEIHDSETDEILDCFATSEEAYEATYTGQYPEDVYVAYLSSFDYEDDGQPSFMDEHDSSMASVGWGTDEDYGYFGGDDDY